MSDVTPAMTPRVAAYRAQLLAQNGNNEALADLTIDHLRQEGAVLQARQVELRAALAKLDNETAAHNAETRRQLAPLQAEAERLAAAATKAAAMLDSVRIARQSDLLVALGKRRAGIIAELQAPYSPGFKLIPWRAHKEGEPVIAPMIFPNGN